MKRYYKIICYPNIHYWFEIDENLDCFYFTLKNLSSQEDFGECDISAYINMKEGARWHEEVSRESFYERLELLHSRM